MVAGIAADGCAAKLRGQPLADKQRRVTAGRIEAGLPTAAAGSGS